MFTVMLGVPSIEGGLGWVSYIQLTIPSEPAMAVSMAMSTLSKVLQFICFIVVLWVMGLKVIGLASRVSNKNLFMIICGSICGHLC